VVVLGTSGDWEWQAERLDPKVSALTPPPHQRGLLPQPSSPAGSSHLLPHRGMAASFRGGLPA